MPGGAWLEQVGLVAARADDARRCFLERHREASGIDRHGRLTFPASKRPDHHIRQIE